MAIATMAILVMVMAGLIPLYSDEVAMQMSRSRFFQEDAHLLNLLPQCRDLRVAIPSAWLPGAVFNAVLYSGATEWDLRLRGIALCLGWLAILWAWARRHPQRLMATHRFGLLVLSLNLVGVMPLVLVLARAEQLMVIALAFYCLWPFHFAIAPADRWPMRAGKAAGFVVLTSIFLLAHPKALFFAPVILLSGFFSFRPGGWRGTTVVLAVATAMIFQTFRQAQLIGQCSAAPLLSQMLAQQTLDFRLLFAQPGLFFDGAVHNLLAAPAAILNRVPLSVDFQSGWLPSIVDPAAPSWLAAFAFVLKWSLAAGALALVMATGVQSATAFKRKTFRPAPCLALGMLASLALHGALYSSSIWHFYTPGLIVPIFVLLLMLTTQGRADKTPAAWKLVLANAVSLYAAALALASMILLVYFVGPGLLGLTKLDRFDLPGQPLSTPLWLSTDRRQQLQHLAQQCKLADGDRRLVVDGSGYFMFQHGAEPIHVLYVSSYAMGADIGAALPSFMKKIDSSGLLARCEYLPPGMAGRAIAEGSMCCLSKAQLEQN
ncbi:MAG: hypothetical protein EOP24_35525 [Hyphomicrobiales bacterium]|nr:MAG: hypothetical protein EOP24_35525 [Hyphomicrobiales bacterium]